MAPSNANTTSNGTITTDQYAVKIRDQYFHIEIFLYNQIDGYKPLNLPFIFVNSFSLNESLLNWITNGWIILSSDFEVLERGGSSVPGNNVNYNVSTAPNGNTPASTSKNPPYLFRTDGRNRISFRVFPIKTDSTTAENSTFDPNFWELSFDFVIYDVEDLPTNSNQKKLKKYYFWDERFQILSERNIEYSTAYSAQQRVSVTPTFNGITTTTITTNIPPSTLVDSKRSVTPNFALQQIIKTASSNPPIMTNINSNSKINVGFLYSENGGSIDNPTQPMDKIDVENWDNGDDSNLVFYTSPANATAIDDINYILEYCTSSDKGPVFLDFGRSTNDKTWKLLSLSSLFKQSKSLQVERLFIEDSVATTKPVVHRADSTVQGNTQNFTSAVASRIQSYSFSPMVALDDARITNAPIHNFDFSTGKFKILFKNNKAQDVRDKMQSFAKLGLYSFSPENTNTGQILLNLNQTKTAGINLENNFISQRFFPSNLTQIKMLKDALFLNEAINFSVQGLTLRTPGKFLFIDRLASDGTINPFDDRFLGQWLAVKVNHVFTQKSYTNEVIAVKVDSFSQLWSNTENKY